AQVGGDDVAAADGDLGRLVGEGDAGAGATVGVDRRVGRGPVVGPGNLVGRQRARAEAYAADEQHGDRRDEGGEETFHVWVLSVRGFVHTDQLEGAIPTGSSGRSLVRGGKM